MSNFYCCWPVAIPQTHIDLLRIRTDRVGLLFAYDLPILDEEPAIVVCIKLVIPRAGKYYGTESKRALPWPLRVLQNGSISYRERDQVNILD